MSYKQDGFTIVELMVALSLLGLVLSIGYMFLNFGLSSFDRGEQRAIAQQAARLTADFITSELRFANKVEINPLEASMQVGSCYFYQSEDNSIIHRNESGSERILADSQADGISYSIQFNSNVPDDVVIFNIVADLGLHSLITRVQALNISLNRTYSPEGKMIKLNVGDGRVIKYQKP